MASLRRRLLFVVENLTLTQVVRLVALAAQLDPERYEVHFAASEFDPLVFGGKHFHTWPIQSIDKEGSLRKLERGERLYDSQVLNAYVDEELALFARVRPDLVIGDFRMSLATSAELAGLPVAVLINAYWSPYAIRDVFPVPDHPIVSLVGVERAQRYLPQALPKAFAYFVAPLNKVRAARGLTPVAGLLEALTQGDFTLYPDVPELCPTARLPASHRYLGPVLWSPELELPGFAAELPGDMPLVYITLGSSGLVSALDKVLAAVAELPVLALLATADRAVIRKAPKNVRVASYLPGTLASRAAAFVVTNGGASTSYQALAEGKPVLGIPSNMDQYLAMTGVERARAGVLVRGGNATKASILTAMRELLEKNQLRAGAAALGRAFASHDCHARFGSFLEDALETGRSRATSS